MNPPEKRHSFQSLIMPPAPPAAPAEGPTPSGVIPSAPAVRPAHRERSAHDSHVRLRPHALPRATDVEFLDAQELLEELAEDHAVMVACLRTLDEAVVQAPRDPSARAALRTLEARLADLAVLHSALAGVHCVAVDHRLHRLFVPEAPLADYLRGVYAWVHAVVRALDQLAFSLHTLQPDWSLLRWRIEEARNFHFDELFEPIRADLLAVSIVSNGGAFGAHAPPIAELERSMERVFAAAIGLDERLTERFG